MIVSASRRTDIPAFFADWFAARVREGFVDTANPFNAAQVRRVSLLPHDVDGFVFWSKNPAPLLKEKDVLAPFAHYLQFTITGYGGELEPRVPPLHESLDAFRRWVDAFGPGTALWRYDPILLGAGWTTERHAENFARIAGALKGYSPLCAMSFLDEYRCTAKAQRELGFGPPGEPDARALAAAFAPLAKAAGMTLHACCEPVDLTDLGVTPAGCVDASRLSALSGRPIKAARDKGQRPGCSCAQRVDIGRYGTCAMGCRYCYACRGRLQTSGG